MSDGSKVPARKRIRLSRETYIEGHAFFVTVCTEGRHRWFAKHTDLAESMVSVLTEAADVRHSNLYAWCVMPDHLHLLVCDNDLVEFVRLVKGRMTPLARRANPKRKLWQRSFYDHALRGAEDLFDVGAYIFENPVRAGIVDDPADYPWSGSLVWEEWRDYRWSYDPAGITGLFAE